MVIVLSILKIIGLILLIAALAAACVLFLPLQYEGSGDIDRKTFHVRLSWLVRIIQFRVQNEGDAVEYGLYLFGIRTNFLDPEKMEQRKRKKAIRQSKKRRRKYKRARKRYLKEKEKKQAQVLLDPEKNKSSDPKPEALKTENTDAADDAAGGKDTGDGRHASAKKSEDTGSGQFSVLWLKIKKAWSVWKAAKEAELLHLLLPVKFLLYHMRPRKISGDIRFGFDDPSLTGKLVGALSCVFVLYQYEELYMTPDFETEESFLSGSVRGKGHIRMIHVLLCGIRILKQKEFRGFLKSLKQI